MIRRLIDADRKLAARLPLPVFGLIVGIGASVLIIIGTLIFQGSIDYATAIGTGIGGFAGGWWGQARRRNSDDPLY